MKTFYYHQYVRENYKIQAETEEEALEILYSGEIDPYDTDYSDGAILDEVRNAN